MMETGPDLRTAGQARPGCPVSQVKDKLRRAGLRPTRQRICLGWLLFGKGDRHITADTLFDEAQRARVPLTLATVYNTLKQFTDAGLLRQIAVEGRKAYFDTDVTDHHHFLVDGEGELIDAPHTSAPLTVTDLPAAPAGYEIKRVDVIIRLRRRSGAPRRISGAQAP
ncbi:Fur family transcriptional regulator Irr [Microvirga sp. CF3016]|uniref:Fur family transcriptional regulator Irr n=1 Tax=Microvirga sp. CF3016 TaxID=3110181 RepID=UPI002E7A3240|nr:Fur family transcriptional regulator [Microvirga sp. CF3016]MEE1609817.1 Fur family transcriptional regulator [Microvirga sp. CF3016]